MQLRTDFVIFLFFLITLLFSYFKHLFHYFYLLLCLFYSLFEFLCPFLSFRAFLYICQNSFRRSKKSFLHFFYLLFHQQDSLFHLMKLLAQLWWSQLEWFLEFVINRVQLKRYWSFNYLIFFHSFEDKKNYTLALYAKVSRVFEKQEHIKDGWKGFTKGNWKLIVLESACPAFRARFWSQR